MKLETETTKGTKLVFETKKDEYSWEYNTTVKFLDPIKKVEVETNINRNIEIKENEGKEYKGIYLHTNPVIFLSLRNITEVETYFTKINLLEKDIRENWIKINLGVCFSSDYNCHYWEGDQRTPIEQILKESEKELSCCHKKHTEETKKRIINAITEKEKKNKAKNKMNDEIQKLANMDVKGVVILDQEVAPEEGYTQEEIQNTLWNSPPTKKGQGRYIIMNSVIKKEDFKKINAIYWDREFLEEMDMFTAQAGWRITAKDIAILRNNNYEIYIK